MKDQVYLGVDLGAESGRMMAGCWDGSRLVLEELHRFPNGPVEIQGTLRWDVVRLWSEIQTGLTAAAKKFGKRVVSVGVDTWGVDFVLLSSSNEMLGQPFHYRDARTRGMLDEAFRVVPRDEVFRQTGVQFMELNTLYQLLALQKQSPEILAAADCFLTMPDYLHFCLSGTKACEFSIATTTQCYHPIERDWARGMLQRFGLPIKMFPKIVPPGTRLGTLLESVSKRTGLGPINVVTPAAHDTGSAVAAVPTALTGKNNWAYLSSGTWSLMGMERTDADISPQALGLDFTNEGGINGTFRFLKMIIGLWLLQQCRRSFVEKGKEISYPELDRLAEASEPFRSLINPDDPRFLNPPDMPDAIREYCRQTGQPAPETEGQFARCVCESLALKYAKTLQGMQVHLGTPIEVLQVVGGGSKSDLLNAFTANACGCQVVAGPVEATVAGNLLVQIMAAGEIASLSDLRAVVRASFETRPFSPDATAVDAWQSARDRYAKLP